MSAGTIRRALARLRSSLSANRRAFALALTMTLAFTGLAVAQGDGREARERSDGLAAEDEERLRERREREEAERERRRDDPKERERRERSRSAYSDERLSASEARALARERFPGLLLDSPFEEPLAEPGGRLKRFLSDHAALVEDSDGEAQILESPGVPLRDSGGEEIDLDLDESPASFRPEASASTLRLPKDLSEGIELPRAAVKLRPAGAGSDDPEGRQVGRSVGWASTGASAKGETRDTDLYATPTPGGAELTAVLRSERSPEKIELEAELPDGAKLEETPVGGAHVVRDGRELVDISFTLGLDSDGEEIPTSLSVRDGKRLVLEIEHREKSVHYPLALDPVLTSYDSWFSGRDRSAASAHFTPESSHFSQFDFETEAGRACYRDSSSASVNPDCRGLYIWARTVSFSANAWGAWSWRAPGQTSYLTRAEFLSTYFSRDGESTACPEVRYALKTSPGGAYVGVETYQGGQSNATKTITPGEGVTNPDALNAHTAHHELRMECSGRRQDRARVYLGGARLTVEDPEPPSVTQVDHEGRALPTGWTNELFPRVSATATDPGLGVKSVFLRRPSGYESERRMKSSGTSSDCDGTKQRPCPTPGAAAFDYTSGEQGEGVHDFSVRATDALGKTSASRPYQLKLDRSAPSVAPSGSLVDADDGRFRRPGPLSLRVSARDEDPGGPRAGVKRIAVEVDGQLRREALAPAGCTDSCALDKTFDFAPGDFTDGTHVVRVLASDNAGNEAPARSYTLKVDGQKPAVTLTHSLWEKRGQTLPAGEHNLHVDARDGSDADRRAGVRSVEILVDDQREDFYTDASCTPGACSSQVTRDWKLQTAAYGPGEHTVKVVSFDALGEPRDEQSFKVIVSVEPGPSGMGGLEQYFDYDTTETGAGTQAHSNLATGNLVWHSTPVVNPGRGLSSVVNLTYNSQEPTDHPPSAAYAEAGPGFSLGISGLTRLNERLDISKAGAPVADPTAVQGTGAATGWVDLTDSDGTRHRFTKSGDGASYRPPAGVNLHLRKLSTLGLEQRAWAATRPDGVTHYFDGLGYQTAIADRNGNEVRYEYECLAERLTDEVRALSPSPAVGDVVQNVECNRGTVGLKYRVKRVIDPAGRALQIRYFPLSPDTTVRRSGRVKEIEDHAGRVTALDYDDDGRLVTMTQAKGITVDERSFAFGYEPGPTSDPPTANEDPDLAAVTDPRGNTTRFTHEKDSTEPAKPCRAVAKKRVVAIENRRQRTRRIAYDCDDAEKTEQATVTDARLNDTRHTLDERGRPLTIEDARGVATELSWDSDNNVVRTTRAANRPEASTTEMAYDQSGLLTAQTEAAGTPDARRTELLYRDSEGTLDQDRRELRDPTGTLILGSDRQRGFVSDLTAQTSPNGFAGDADRDDYTTTFEPDAKGNVLAQVEPGGHRAETDFFATGEIKEERDQVGNRTQYPDYDPNGLPLTKIDPRLGRWSFRYDAAGNLLSRTDPRKADGDPADAFTTTLAYDAFDRVVEEKRPKDSRAGSFVTRETEYDRNGNETAKIDGENARTEQDYSAMDRPEEVRSPAVAHHGEAGAAPEVTRMSYDAEENMVEQTSPEGNRTQADEDHSTSFAYDSVGQRVAEVKRSRGGDEPDSELSTSWAFDGRGNVVGMSDPRRNAQFGGTPAENAKLPERQRATYEYDRVDNRRFEVEDPAGLGLKSETRYDLNDNVVAEIDPRGEKAGAPEQFMTRMEYDGRDLLTARIDPKGGRTAFELRGDGKVVSETSPRGSASDDDANDFKTKLTYLPTGELESRTLPRAPGQYGPAVQRVSYVRDAVGNPTRITDARGNAFENAFYDTGDLRSTERPSWWSERGEEGAPEGDGGEGTEGEPAPMDDEMGQGTVATGSASEPGGDAAATGPSSADGAAATGPSSGDGPPPTGITPAESGAEDPSGEAGSPESSQQIVERGPSPSSGEPGELPESEGAGDFGSVKPQKMPEPMPKAGLAELAYDSEMRLTEVTSRPPNPDDEPELRPFSATMTYDALGRTTERKLPIEASAARYMTQTMAYDRNGNTREQRDGEGNPTVTSYDQFDRPVREAAPGSSAGQEELTLTTYDRNGNALTRQTPRGADFTERMGYDALDRLLSEKNPAGEETTYTYDPAGNRASVRSPRGNAAGLSEPQRASFTTTYEYDARNLQVKVTDGLSQATTLVYDENGNQVEVTAPGASPGPGEEPEPSVTRRTFDGRDLRWSETQATGDHEHTTYTEFDGNGNLRREVKPGGVSEDTGRPAEGDSGEGTPAAPATKHATVREYSADDLLQSVHLPWGERDAEDRRRYRQDFTLDPRGRVSSIDAPYEWTNPDAKTSRTSYTHFDSGWIKSSSDPVLVDPDSEAPVKTQAFTYGYDRRGLQQRWTSAEGRNVDRSFAPDGTMSERLASKPGSVSRRYAYAYNENRSMTQMVDENLNRTTDITRDGAERETLLDETWSAGRDTKTSYDPNGNVSERLTDGTYSGSYQGGKQTTFVYDALDRESEMWVGMAGQSLDSYLTSYHPSGQEKTLRKPSGVSETRYYHDSELARTLTDAPGQAATRDQTYAYDRDHNRTSDERGTHAYNARDQLVSYTRPEGQPGAGTSVDYDLDGTGAILREEDRSSATPESPQGTVTASRYNGERLLSQTTTEPYPNPADTTPAPDPSTTSFTYDDLGSVVKEERQAGSGPKTGTDPLRLRRLRAHDPGQGPRVL